MPVIDFSKTISENMFPYDNNEPPKMEAYDSLWGFYVVKQDVNFEYNDSNYSYKSGATITINGVFSISAETGGNYESLSDMDRYNLLKAKYSALRAYFIGTTKTIPPSGFLYYGTASDPRCIALPDRLKDSLGRRIYARPRSLSITQNIWANKIEYAAILEEVQQPSCKIALDDYIINNGVLTVVGRTPRMAEEKYYSANSGELYFSGLSNRSYQLSGDISMISPSGQIIPDAANGLLNKLSTGKCSLGIERSDGTKELIVEEMFIGSASVNSEGNKDGMSISVEGKE